MLATQVDDYLYAGTEKRIKAFEQFLKDTFKVSKLACSNQELMGFVIARQDDAFRKLSQTKNVS